MATTTPELAYNGHFENTFDVRYPVIHDGRTEYVYKARVSPFELSHIGDADIDDVMLRSMAQPRVFIPLQSRVIKPIRRFSAVLL